MICPRCADEQIEVMAKSPVKDVWTVYQCQHCLYTWRQISANKKGPGRGFALPGHVI